MKRGRILRGVIQGLLAISVLVAGLALTHRLILSRPEVERLPPKRVLPQVEVEEVELETIRPIIEGEGTVRPSKVVDLIAQVSGRVVSISPNLVSGGRFRKGEPLIKLDNRDYKLALLMEEAEVRAQESRLKELIEESEAAREEWRLLNPDEEPPPLLLKVPEIRAAEAALEAARARVERARLDLERTEMEAPFDGVVLSEDVDEGEYVRAGEKVATIFSSEAVEIKVYLELQKSSFIDIPGFNSEADRGSRAVVLATIGRETYRWDGYVSRSEAVDERTRTIPVLVTVEDPYGRMPPLAVGLFVKVEIEGRPLEGVALIPQGALKRAEDGRAFVWIVDGEDRLRRRWIEVLVPMGDRLLIRGVEEGEEVVVSMTTLGVEGMKVRPYPKER